MLKKNEKRHNATIQNILKLHSTIHKTKKNFYYFFYDIKKQDGVV